MITNLVESEYYPWLLLSVSCLFFWLALRDYQAGNYLMAMMESSVISASMAAFLYQRALNRSEHVNGQLIKQSLRFVATIQEQQNQLIKLNHDLNSHDFGKIHRKGESQK